MPVSTLDPAGFAMVPGLFSAREARALGDEVVAALLRPGAVERGAIVSPAVGVYAARNVLQLWPRAADVWRHPTLVDSLTALLGCHFGLVRVLFFDKPPGQTWALPWHKDLTVAVRDNRLAGCQFVKPTTKAGVPHVEAPLEVLSQMVTIRLHLDDVTEDNGPLRVLPGSHLMGKEEIFEGMPTNILAEAGDALLMRPLLMHCSNRSRDGTSRHRRILHVEFAAHPELPDGFQWHTFIPGLP